MQASIFDRAREAARLTPAGRNRSADFYRTVAIYCVVFGHWMLAAPYAPGGQFEMRWIVAEQPWTQYLTWIFQVMPVFFFVGGYANAVSWSAARGRPESRRFWAGSRMVRLLLPVVPLVLLWSVAAIVAHLLGISSDTVIGISRDPLRPVWFLAVYVVVTLVVPLSYAAFDRWGLWSVAGLALLALIVDVIGVGMGQTWLRWANYGPIWLGVHQLGYWWKRGDVTAARAGLLVGLGAVWMAALILLAGYPVSMISVAGQSFSNDFPPTTMLLALGSVQIGLLLLLAPRVSRWLEREGPWSIVILLGRNIMTIYLWQLTAVALLIVVALALGGIGLKAVPGSAAWWALHPIWLVMYAGVLIGFIALFGRYESGSRAASQPQVGVVQTVLGTLAACYGLSGLSLNGIGSTGPLGLNWLAVLPLLAGVALATGLHPGAARRKD